MFKDRRWRAIREGDRRRFRADRAQLRRFPATDLRGCGVYSPAEHLASRFKGELHVKMSLATSNGIELSFIFGNLFIIYRSEKFLILLYTCVCNCTIIIN